MTCAQGLLRLLWGGPEVGVLRDWGLSLQKNFKAITDYVRPRTKRQLRRFLGMIQFYCRFILDCAEILSLLYSLLSAGTKMTHLLWAPETENCFSKAKQAIEKATVLAHPNHEANLG